MRIELPDFETDKALTHARAFHDLTVDEDVYISMSPKWARPFGMLFIAIALRQWRSIYPSIQFYASIGGGQAVDYVGHMGFFKTISEKIHVGKTPGEAFGNENYVPITRINISDLSESAILGGRHLAVGDLVESESRRLATVLSRDPDANGLLTYVLRELIRNVPEHSNSSIVWVCGQHWASNEAEVAIIDEGIGVRKSLERNPSHREYIQVDDDALRLSIKAGISQAFRLGGKQPSDDIWANSGFGLYTVSSLVQVFGGSFCLASGGRFIKMDENNRITLGDTWFDGTAVKVTLKDMGIKNSKEHIQEIVRKGEIEARQIRNAFSRASRPSKGLLLGD